MAYCNRCGAWVWDGILHFCSTPSPMGYSVVATLQVEALNDEIGVEPFKTDAVEKNVKSAFATVKQKTSLTPLKVIYGNNTIPAGSEVWVRGDLCREAAGQNVFEVEGTQVIFIPIKECKIVRRWENNANSGSMSWTLTERKGGTI